ncbi:hypothetical protein FNB15_09200 [Ferrovibrio terrae]|uniref:Uncharacterized protein n=1 Tax=Ferrovibrio terrae TaxID=2594003 RepID=A0A516H1I1_9PROT|nr:hypothetical protein [Ferrovibrio terrae]QDO97430.1 hypothetical protein FNB15_09200 [Ferrovibrio terrae]
MIRVFKSMMLLAAIVFAAGAAQAQVQGNQAAVVEDLSGTVSGVEVFDFLSPGKTVTLPAGAKLVLGYMNSCTRETITGAGTVTIGETGSKVSGARLQTEQLKCAAANQLAQGQAGKSAAMVFRGQPGSGRKRAEVPQPSAVLMYTAPAFQVLKPGQLTIERLDVAETVQVFQVTGKLFDYGKTGKKLDAGGYYRVELNGKSTVFHISLDAGEGAGPLLLRLVRF